MARVREYVAAGADMIYPDAIRNEDDIQRVIEAARDVPVNINMGFGIRSRPTTPLIPLSRLKAMGVARVSLPRFMTAAALSGMQKAIEVLKQTHRDRRGGRSARPPGRAWRRSPGCSTTRPSPQLETELLDDEELDRRYGEGAREYVIKGSRA